MKTNPPLCLCLKQGWAWRKCCVCVPVHACACKPRYDCTIWQDICTFGFICSFVTFNVQKMKKKFQSKMTWPPKVLCLNLFLLQIYEIISSRLKLSSMDTIIYLRFSIFVRLVQLFRAALFSRSTAVACRRVPIQVCHFWYNSVIAA